MSEEKTETEVAEVSNSGFVITFNILQQGVNDMLGLPLTEVSEGVYSGSFKISKSDGVFNRDGVSAIVVNIPNVCTSVIGGSCGSDKKDKLNRMDLSILGDRSVSYAKFSDSVDPANALTAYNKSRSTVGNSVSLYEKSVQGDEQFVFGNPEFFRRKFPDGDKNVNSKF